MFPQILPKPKFEKVLHVKLEAFLKTCRKKRHKESVALKSVNLFCLHLLDKKGQSWITVNRATMKNRNSFFPPVYYIENYISDLPHIWDWEKIFNSFHSFGRLDSVGSYFELAFSYYSNSQKGTWPLIFIISNFPTSVSTTKSKPTHWYCMAPILLKGKVKEVCLNAPSAGTTVGCTRWTVVWAHCFSFAKNNSRSTAA